MKFKLPNLKPMHVVDVLSVAIGVGAFVYGFWMFWKPGAFIVSGLLLACTGVFSSLGEKSEDHGEGWE